MEWSWDSVDVIERSSQHLAAGVPDRALGLRQIVGPPGADPQLDSLGGHAGGYRPAESPRSRHHQSSTPTDRR